MTNNCKLSDIGLSGNHGRLERRPNGINWQSWCHSKMILESLSVRGHLAHIIRDPLILIDFDDLASLNLKTILRENWVAGIEASGEKLMAVEGSLVEVSDSMLHWILLT